MAVFRVEKTQNYTVMSNHHLRNTLLSMKAKGLMSLMLSLPDNWDYTLYGLSTISSDGLSSIRAAIAELEEAGYLRRRRLRNDKGQLTETEYTILEQPGPPGGQGAPICENPILDKPTLEKPTQGKPILENRTQLNTNKSNKEKRNTDSSSTHQSIPSGAADESERPDAISDAMDAYRENLCESIGYVALVERHGADQIDELVQLIVDTICSRRQSIRIDRSDFPAQVVKSRLLKLRGEHIDYVMDCMTRNTTKINNIRNYLLTALYNASTTMESHYRAAVNHDLYGEQ